MKAVNIETGQEAELAARAAVVKTLGSVSFDGASGPVALDGFGDPKTAPFTLYKVTGTEWVAQ